MRKAVVNENDCVACGVCVKTCPKSAVSVFKGSYAMVDRNICVGCGLCGKTCPTGAIEVKEASDA